MLWWWVLGRLEEVLVCKLAEELACKLELELACMLEVELGHRKTSLLQGIGPLLHR